MKDLDRLAQDFEDGADLVERDIRPVVSKGGLNIKLATQKRWRGLGNAPLLASAVGYDIDVVSPGRISAEIGPDKDKPHGALGNVIEYGSVNNAPHPGLAPSLAEEEPRFAKALEDLGVKGMPS